VANNSTLSQVLKAIQNATGAKIEGVEPAESERVFGEFGPGPPQMVCSKLLTGSHYDFILMGAPENPDVIQRIILTERSTELATSPSAPAASQPTQADDTNDDQEMDAAGNNQVETPNQVPMTPEQQQILPPPADSAQSQPATDAQPAAQAPTRPQHWGVNSHPVPAPTPEPTPAPPH
jgi:hypothetical protein